eukprot:CAMPEP_0181315454 /NCGR_PEP_ID=MMETSP1101-20121128/15387_1 /TAXON_ID=46948 /ORGANISM="Rhodomonas abbreviata, Strain Caron Lab Isolate" /LENGTH=222 /DNA_ID=CAMNT_0023422669 /DNA_START=132 /DNA_END=797 /DNA_ORIENTATION=+
MGDYADDAPPTEYADNGASGEGNGDLGAAEGASVPAGESHGNGGEEGDAGREDPANPVPESSQQGGESYGRSGEGETANREEPSAESQGMKLFIGGLPFKFTDSELATHFETYGRVLSANVILDRETQKSRGFGFVTMESQEAAERVIREVHESEIEGRPVTVKVAVEKGTMPPPTDLVGVDTKAVAGMVAVGVMADETMGIVAGTVTVEGMGGGQTIGGAG